MWPRIGRRRSRSCWVPVSVEVSGCGAGVETFPSLSPPLPLPLPLPVLDFGFGGPRYLSRDVVDQLGGSKTSGGSCEYTSAKAEHCSMTFSASFFFSSSFQILVLSRVRSSSNRCPAPVRGPASVAPGLVLISWAPCPKSVAGRLVAVSCETCPPFLAPMIFALTSLRISVCPAFFMDSGGGGVFFRKTPTGVSCYCGQPYSFAQDRPQ